MTKQEILNIVNATTAEMKLANARQYLISKGITPTDSLVISAATIATKAVLADASLLLDTINIKAGNHVSS